MNQLDYYQNPEILSAIGQNMRFVKNREDREDLQQELWAVLYDFMPPSTEDAIKLIDRTAAKFKYRVKKIAEYEASWDFDCTGESVHEMA